MRATLKVLPLLAAAAASIATAGAQAQDKVSFGTNWRAQAEHGGYYQAVAAGIYAKHGLDVTIRPGGPQVNNAQLLAAGRIDFNMGGSTFNSLNYVVEKVPIATIAAIFQKDPIVLIAHPGAGNDTLEGL
jgi:NitT/TauT family transport system substrate-binding protein